MIPYHMYKDNGCRSIVVTNKNDDSYDYLENEAKGLKLHFIKGRGVSYVIRYAKKIDVLNVYHLNLQSFYLLVIFKLLKKKGAKSYLKLDMDNEGLRRLFMNNPVGLIKRLTVKAADVVSAETEDIYEELRNRYGKKMIFVTNGYYTTESRPQSGFIKKNEILTVGLLGTEAKATDVLIKAFVKAAGERTDWTLRLVGPVAEGFINPCPDDERIVFTGEITDKEKLNDIYRSARVFAFPSRHESFGIVMLEAAACGDYIISTEGVPAAKDIINKTGAGAIVPVDDVDALAEELKKTMDLGEKLDEQAENTARIIYESYRWEDITKDLYKALS